MYKDKHFSILIEKTFSGQTYTREEATLLLDYMIDGHMSDSRIAAVLTSMRFSTISERELILGAMDSVLKHTQRFCCHQNESVEINGVGSSYMQTYNIPILSGIIVATSGVCVAQFGGRNETIQNNNAEILERIGIKLSNNIEELTNDLEKNNISYLYSLGFYPKLKVVSTVRKHLGFHTIFDLIYPLVNPVNLYGQIVSVYDRKLLNTVAECLIIAGRKKGLVIYAEDGLGVISATGLTHVLRIENMRIYEEYWTPEMLNLSKVCVSDCKIRAIDDNVKLMCDLFENKLVENSYIYNSVLINAGALLWVGNKVESPTAGANLARELLKSGKVLQKLNDWKQFGSI